MQAARAKKDSLRRLFNRKRVGVAVIKAVTTQAPSCEISEHPSNSSLQ